MPSVCFIHNMFIFKRKAHGSVCLPYNCQHGAVYRMKIKYDQDKFGVFCRLKTPGKLSSRTQTVTSYEKVPAQHRKKWPHVAQFNVARDWFETNSRNKKRYSEAPYTLIRFQTKTELFCSVFKKIWVHTYPFRPPYPFWKRFYTLSAHNSVCLPFWIPTVELSGTRSRLFWWRNRFSDSIVFSVHTRK